MEVISLNDAKEMIKIFCKKYGIEGEFQDNPNGGIIISPIWCNSVERNCGVSFLLDGSDCSITTSLLLGMVKDSTAKSYAEIINRTGLLGFEAFADNTFMLCKKVSYATDENFFMILYTRLQEVLKIMEHEIFVTLVNATNPL